MNVEVHTVGLCAGYTLCKVFTFNQYSQCKGSGRDVCSNSFYSYKHGFKFILGIYYCGNIGTYLYLMTGEYVDHLPWPISIKVHLELLNQAGEHHHVERTKIKNWGKDNRNCYKVIPMMYSDLENRGDGVQHVINDCLQLRLCLTVQTAQLLQITDQR